MKEIEQNNVLFNIEHRKEFFINIIIHVNNVHAHRIKNMLDIITSPDQTGFISEKYISENARLILWLFAIYRGNDIPGVL